MKNIQGRFSMKNICLFLAGSIGGGVLIDQVIFGHPSTLQRQVIVLIAVLFFVLFWLIPEDIRKTIQSWHA